MRINYEDFYWSMLATQAEAGGFLGVKETANQLKKHAQRAGVNLEDETSGQTITDV